MPIPEANFIIQVHNLILPAPGQYDFEVLVDDEEIGILPIAVEQVKPPSPPPVAYADSQLQQQQQQQQQHQQHSPPNTHLKRL